MGVIKGSDMITEMANAIIVILPEFVTPHLRRFIALFAVPLLMILGTNAFYYAMLATIADSLAGQHCLPDSLHNFVCEQEAHNKPAAAIQSHNPQTGIKCRYGKIRSARFILSVMRRRPAAFPSCLSAFIVLRTYALFQAQIVSLCNHAVDYQPARIKKEETMDYFIM